MIFSNTVDLGHKIGPTRYYKYYFLKVSQMKKYFCGLYVTFRQCLTLLVNYIYTCNDESTPKNVCKPHVQQIA